MIGKLRTRVNCINLLMEFDISCIKSEIHVFSIVCFLEICSIVSSVVRLSHFIHRSCVFFERAVCFFLFLTLKRRVRARSSRFVLSFRPTDSGKR